MHIRLRDYQEHDVEAIREAFGQGRKAPLYVLPTGGGKTVTFCYIAYNAARKGTKVCIHVHREHLIWQTSRTLKEWGVPHGVIAPGMQELPDMPVQVASIWSIARRPHWFDQFGLHIVDEAHHAVAGTWTKVLGSATGKVLGVTATPARLDGKGLGHLFDDMIFGPSMADLIGEGYLARPRTFRPATAPTMKGVKKSGGDYNRGAANEIMDRRVITGDAIAHYGRILQGAPALVFCCTNEHAEHVRQDFAAAGYRAGRIDQSTPMDKRRQMLNDLARGVLQVITSCEVISEGTDVPQCWGSILLRPTDSLVLYLQQVGRALRPKQDNTDAIILDHAGNSYRHGLPEVDRQWTLDRGVASERNGATPIRTCHSCFAIMPAQQLKCPVCGAEKKVAEGNRMPRQKAGELMEAAGMTLPPNLDPTTAPLKDVAKHARTLEQLQTIEKVRGYKKGWAKQFHEARQQARDRIRMEKRRDIGAWRFAGGVKPW